MPLHLSLEDKKKLVQNDVDNPDYIVEVYAWSQMPREEGSVSWCKETEVCSKAKEATLAYLPENQIEEEKSAETIRLL